MGRQFRMQVGNEEFFPDLLFYNTKLRAYYVVELKIGKFKPEYQLSQLYPADFSSSLPTIKEIEEGLKDA